MKDSKDNSILVGDSVRVISIPDINYPEDEIEDVKSMKGEIFKIESIENDHVEVTKWWKKENESYSHSLYLTSTEIELVEKLDASA